jgi:ketol-acid reductoisomerase
VVDEHVEATLQQILDDIRSGDFAREWVLENKAGTPVLDARRREQASHPIEAVGANLREMMSWMKQA